MNLGVAIPLVIFLATLFLVGFYAARFVKQGPDFLQEYFLGGRNLGGLVLAMTMVATYGSASSFIGGPGVAYNTGLGWVLLSMAQVVTGYFTLSVLGKKFAITARKIKAVTINDFLRERYNSKWVVILSSVCIVIFLFASMAAQWIGGGRLLESFMGVSYQTALFIFTISVLFFVVIGGFRAVALTDTILGFIMFIGTLIILIGTIIAGGGVTNIMNELVAENPNLITPFGADGSLTPLYVSSFWILVGVGVVALPQIAVRAMSYKNSKAMHTAMIIGTIVTGIIMLGMHLTGVFARAVMPGIEIGDTVMPTLTLSILPSWLAGIVLAAPIAAVVSTVNSLLLLVSSALVKDIYINYIKPTASEKRIKNVSLSVTALLGLLVYLSAIHPPDLLIWLNLFAFGGLEAAFIWPIVLGLYWRKGNAYGAISSMIFGVGSYILLDRLSPNLWGMHTVVVPVLLSLIVYVSVSLLTMNRNVQQQQKIEDKFWYV
ncbi:sodium/pantothenate symporter [Cytobacillus purgationiresistens]|uniref:Sodium/pantothenate symporter n=1 Tax=Cytobacillus purgationiresistens TaxID=863449 RepID=A0ABU0ALD8_9BACI|nr:sodium/pantothenate symporter [Cytobacillus purgationiresistens]MDQ0272086.1 sodium/pantothenate symporter [Cytobacillus purgationiresistens]